MKRSAAWVLAVSLLSIVSIKAQAPAPFPAGLDGELYFCPRIDLVPASEGGPLKVTLDGVLDEPVWKRAAFHTVKTFLETGQPANIQPPELDFDMIFAVVADLNNLYIAWKVVDDILITGEQTGCLVWQDDSVEFYIDANDNGPNCTSGTTSCYAADDAQITVGADQIGKDDPDMLEFGGVAGSGNCDFGGQPWPDLVRGVVKELQQGDLGGTFGQGLTGWQAEIAIALDTLGNGGDGTPEWHIVPDHGTCIGFSAQGNDDDGPEIADRDHKIAWAKRETAESAWRNPGVFGKLSFFDPTKAVSQGACALPVERLACKRNADGTVAVTWKNPGTADPNVPTKIEVDGALKATVPGSATSATLSQADVPIDGKDHIIGVINNSDEAPPTCVIVQSPFAECGGIRFWNILGAYEQPGTGGAAPSQDDIRRDYMTDGLVGELDFEWKTGAQIQTDFANAAASTAIKNGLGPPRNPGTPPVPTVFEWKDADSRVSFQEVFRFPFENTMAYAQAYVINKTAAPIEVYMGISSDDSIQVYLNGEEAWINSTGRPGSDACTPQDISPDGGFFTSLHVLDPGQNNLILKIFQGTGQWEFAIRFQDANGDPVTEGLDVSLVPTITVARFHRGDSDGNGTMQLTDAVRILNFLFLGTGHIDCMDAADADNNGTVQLTDAVRILNVLFLGVGSIPDPGAPGETFGNKPCGPDPGADADHVGCDSYNACGG